MPWCSLKGRGARYLRVQLRRYSRVSLRERWWLRVVRRRRDCCLTQPTPKTCCSIAPICAIFWALAWCSRGCGLAWSREEGRGRGGEGGRSWKVRRRVEKRVEREKESMREVRMHQIFFLMRSWRTYSTLRTHPWSNRLRTFSYARTSLSEPLKKY